MYITIVTVSGACIYLFIVHEFALNILYILSIITDQHFVGHLVEQVWFGRTVYIGNKGPKHPYAVYLYL